MRSCRIIVFLAITSVATGCTAESEFPYMPDPSLREQALTLARQTIIVDGHVDIPYRLTELDEDISQRTERGDFDYVRAVEGGLDAPFMSIYIPSSYQETGGAMEKADSLIDMVYGFEEKWPDKFAVALSPDDIERNFEAGLISLPMGMENGAPIGDDLSRLEYFHDRGIRYITLTHATDNLISDSSYDTTSTWNGLSPFGREVVAEMNRLGIMVDISHVSDSAFYQVLEVTRAPIIASHSSCRYFTPGWERNMSDDMIRRLGQNGGVIMISFGSSFLDDSYRQRRESSQVHIREYLREQGLDPSHPDAERYITDYMAEHVGYADLSHVVAHIEHAVSIAGIDHVGLGSDFDGVGDTLPTGLKDASEMPNLVYALLEKGYSEEDIRKILSGNILRVWREVSNG
jgi:membrane dipeptidase